MLKWTFPPAALIAALIALASCVGPGADKPPFSPIEVPPPPASESALAAGVSAGPSIRALRLGAEDAAGALAAFRTSCDWASGKQLSLIHI